MFETNPLCEKKMVKMVSTATTKGPKYSWDSSGESGDIFGICLEKLPYEDVIRAKLVSKHFKDYIESDAFCRRRGIARPVEASLTSLYFFVRHGYWQCSGFDLTSGQWRRLPPLTYLPPPQNYTQQNYLIAGGGGLFCVNVSQTSDEEMLIVCNPLTQEHVLLPPLHSRRNPVLLHLLANPATNSYQVIAAGSSSDTGDGLSQCTEVFDSVTWKWTETGDIPGYDFFLNEYQTGVCKNGILYCVAYAKYLFEDEITFVKSVVAYDLEKGTWIMPNRTCLLPLRRDDTAHVAQLVECNEDVYLFLQYSSLREEHPVHELIAKLETSAVSSAGHDHAVGKWKIVMTREGAERGLSAYPEYTCVPYGVGKCCIFNTIEHTGVVYDILEAGDGQSQLILPPPPAMYDGYVFHSLNPLSFTFQLSFHGKCVSPNSHAVTSKESDLMAAFDSQECGRTRVCLWLFPEIINCQGSYSLNHHEEDDQICSSLPDDLLKTCLVRSDYEDLFRMKPVSKLMKQCIESHCFQFLRGEVQANEGLLTALHFSVKNGVWKGSGFDLTMKKWRRLPPFSSPPKPAVCSDSEDYLIAGGGGLVCLLKVSDSNVESRPLVMVCNPLTMKVRALPALKFCRSPVLVHLLSNPTTMSYQVIVVGNSGTVEGVFSEIFDSVTSKWTAAQGDIPGPDFTLSQYQTGASVGRRLYCIAESSSEESKHVLQFNTETGKWSDWNIPLPHPQWSDHATRFCSVYADAQLVACNGSIYLFSRRGLGNKEQCLDRLVLACGADEHHWEHMWRRPEVDQMGISYPEYTCTPFGDDKLCVFNTNEVTGVVYDIHDNSFSELPSPSQRSSGMTYEILNHLGFTLQPNYKQQP